MRFLAASVVAVSLLAPLAPAPAVAASAPDPLRLLHRWDARRAAAYAHEDPAALRGLYLPGSSAATADVALLRSYAARGLRVTELATQVSSSRVLRSGRDRFRVVVVERTYGAVGDRGRCRPLPEDAWHVRSIELVRTDAGWLAGRVGAG